jgi:hypothetical protein
VSDRSESGTHAGAGEADGRRWRALIVGLVAAFMTLLDVSIVNVAIPSIQTGFYINVPVGIVAMILGRRWIPDRPAGQRVGESLDPVGIVLAPGSSCCCCPWSRNAPGKGGANGCWCRPPRPCSPASSVGSAAATDKAPSSI